MKIIFTFFVYFSDAALLSPVFVVDCMRQPYNCSVNWNKDHDPFVELNETTMEEGDYLIVSPRKTGQHWMWEIMNMLLAGKAEYITKGKEKCFVEVLSMQKILEECEHPRVLCTHIPTGTLPKTFRYHR